MIWNVVALLVGLVLAITTLRDVFDTVIVPGESRGTLRVARRMVSLTLPIWRRLRRQGGISSSFAPFVLVGSFVIWMVLLGLGFGLMAWGLADHFRPRIESFPDALYITGSALVTIGLSETDALGVARWLVLAAGFCGLAVMTMAVTYLLEVQAGIAERDSGIMKLTTSAGEPPSAIALLERYAELDFRDQIPRTLGDGRDWCAKVMQSHASHPSLIYFRSKGTGSGWPAALGTMMDLALTVELLLDAPEWRGLAILLREQGGQMVETLIDVVGLEHDLDPPTQAELDALLARLEASGYRLQAKPDRTAFIAQRARYAACVASMAHHLGTANAPLAPVPAPRA